MPARRPASSTWTVILTAPLGSLVPPAPVQGPTVWPSLCVSSAPPRSPTLLAPPLVDGHLSSPWLFQLPIQLWSFFLAVLLNPLSISSSLHRLLHGGFLCHPLLGHITLPLNVLLQSPLTPCSVRICYLVMLRYAFLLVFQFHRHLVYF